MESTGGLWGRLGMSILNNERRTADTIFFKRSRILNKRIVGI